jgi:hypothetical protein
VLKSVDAEFAAEQWDESRLEKHHNPRSLSEAKPPHQMTAYRGDDQTIYCELHISHTIIDGISMINIARDLTLAYSDLLPNGSGPLYRSLLSHLSQQPSSQSIAYWKEHLSGLEPCHFPDLDGRLGGSRKLETIRLEVEKAHELRKFCEINNFTLSNIFQTAWALVLRSYVGTDNVCFGYLAFGRDIPVNQVDDAIGAFATMLVCHADLSSSKSVGLVLETMHRDFLQSLPHQHCSLAEIHHALKLPNGSLFNTIMSFQRLSHIDMPASSAIYLEKILEHDPTEVSLWGDH